LAAEIEIVLAKAAHIRTIAKRMRKADRDEVLAASGKTPFEALAYSLRKSSIAYTGLINGQPEVMFGVGDINILNAVGAPWLLGTDAVERNYLAFLRRSVVWKRFFLERYAVLRNLVDARNTVSIRWLRWLGFTFSEPVNLRGHDFYLFEMTRAEPPLGASGGYGHL
jgi:hypothetical protein